MIPSDEQLIRTLTDLGCSREFATAGIAHDRWAAIKFNEAVQQAREGDWRAAYVVEGARTMFALLAGDLKASPASSCDFDDDAVAREREGWSGDDVDSRLQDIRDDIAAQRQGPRDSPRWCDRCQAWGDHHTDRCTRPSPSPDRTRDDYNPNCEVRP